MKKDFVKELNKEKFFVDDVNTENNDNVVNITYGSHTFPISKRFYTKYCEVHGFLTEEDLTLMFKFIFDEWTEKIENKLNENGDRKVAGMINWVLYSIVKYEDYNIKSEDFYYTWLEDDELGHNLPKLTTDELTAAAHRFIEEKNIDYPSRLTDMISKWKNILHNTEVDEYTREYIEGYLYLDLIVTCDNESYVFDNLALECTDGQLYMVREDLKKDFEENGMKAAISICELR